MDRNHWLSVSSVRMAATPRRDRLSIYYFRDREEVEIYTENTRGRTWDRTTRISVPGRLIRTVLERRLGRSVTFRWKGDALIVTQWPAPDDERGKPTRVRLEAKELAELVASLRPERRWRHGS